MARRVVLVFTKYYLPGYRAGGPIKTIASIVQALHDEIDFNVVTLDRDVGDEVPYSGVKEGQWTFVEGAKVCYLSNKNVTYRRLLRLINEIRPDVIYLNSFWDPVFTQKVLWLKRFNLLGGLPVLLAPRGEFSSGALVTKARKKRVYLFLTKIMGLYKNLTWQASTQMEEKDILQEVGYAVKPNAMYVVPDLTTPLVSDKIGEQRQKRLSGALRVCFLARIHPQKNLDFALEVLSQVKSMVEFTIYGPEEDEVYWNTCNSLIEKLPVNINVRYSGALPSSEVHKALGEQDIFLFPSKGENFGHVIIEALSAGLPVLLSDQVPWGEVVAKGIGWTFPLNSLEPFVRVLEECSNWPSEKWYQVSRDAVAYAQEKTNDPEVLQLNREMFYK